MSKALNDFRLKLGGKEFVPILVGGMGVDISTAELALEVARLGGIGHISDAMVPTVSDRRFKTHFVQEKQRKYKYNVNSADKTVVKFDLERLAEAQRLHVGRTMDAKKGDGAVFVNCMEKLTMNNPRDTLQTRLHAAMDAGVEGITLSAGLHLGSMELMKDHSRFRDVLLGIIVSSARALRPFLKRAAKYKRLPDYIIVEGPLAGGHLGFGIDDWQEYDLKTIVQDVLTFLKENELDIPVIPAGGVFTGTDAVDFFEAGASAVQVATRFTVTKECGLPDRTKHHYFDAVEDDIVVNTISPTGYPMRMLRQSPGIGSGIRPNCEAFGYILDNNGHCAYVEAYNKELENKPEKISIPDKTCLCTHFRKFNIWTCGHYVYRLKDTTHKLENGKYQLLSAEEVFRDYQFSKDHTIKIPEQKEPFSSDVTLAAA
ncbi:MAG: nitronate monooxygenase [SAR324 cluster bacterium]|jgi:nitronate monooxygenase|nr:nitronate monooxygenase [SAR324 cluster bacterium]MDP6295892.1 nitronate monooxygenase [SAR324 cluster bacterium]|tara:strand:- start:94 stop:1380 length:1287 start_codon:yes stop_codon:yes gene_type:complete